MVPENTPIVQFITKFFIEDAAPDALLTTENVRINYCDEQGYETGNPNVVRKYKAFDIYVKAHTLSVFARAITQLRRSPV